MNNQKHQSSTKKLLMAVGILVLFILALSSAYYFRIKNKSEKSQSITNNSNISATSSVKQITSTPDESITAKWQIYKNDKYNYEVSCPKEDTHNIEVNNGNGKTIPLYQEICYQKQNQVRVFVMFVGNDRSGQEGGNKSVSFITPDGKYEIRLEGFNGNYFDAIVSTFRFITPNQSMSTNKWEVYNGQSVSFKYPTDYSVSEKNEAITVQKSPTRALLYLQIFPNTNNLDPQAWLDTQPDQIKMPLVNAYSNRYTYNISSDKGIIMPKNPKATLSGYRDYIVIISHNSKIYMLNFGPSTEAFNISQQILSTFKFSD